MAVNQRSGGRPRQGGRRFTRRPMRDRSVLPRDPNLNTDIFINATSHDKRIAIKENDVLAELLVESPEQERLVGAIFKGNVTTVLPGMQAAFVEIGLEKAAFLHVTDIGVAEGEVDEELEEFDEEDEESGEPIITKKAERAPIQEILKRGQEVVVQIVKEQIGTKGPRVTTQLSLAGRYVVLMPHERVTRVSKRITSWAEKRRLRRVAEGVKPEGYGLIIRTVAENADESDFKEDIRQLVDTWEKVKAENASKPAPCMIFNEGGITNSVVRDLLTEDVRRIIVDSREEHQNLLGFMKQLAPEMRKNVELYNDAQPIFDRFGIEREIDKMFERKVWIKGGAYIVIDQTEALVTIDVNTGRFVGKTDQSTTVLTTNLEAAKEVARQVRLRDIGGLIVVDLIDMYNREHKRQVYDAFCKAFRNDRAKRSISQISEFGLIEMTRERVRPSLMHTFSEPCPTCNGIGRVLSADLMAAKIERWFQRAKATGKHRKFIVSVTPEVGDFIANGGSDRVQQWSRRYHFHIEVIRDTLLHPEKFVIQTLGDNEDITDRYQPGGPKTGSGQ
jgi:ribonuclease G